MTKNTWKFGPDRIREMDLDDLILIEDLQAGEVRFRDFKALLARVLVPGKQVGAVNIGNLQEVGEALGNAVAEVLEPPKKSGTD